MAESERHPQADTRLEAAIAALEAQRSVLGDALVATAVEPLRRKLAEIRSASAADPAPEEQRKQITVLFADLSGFTHWAEARDPETVREQVDALWQRLDAAITSHGGRIDKHIGDGVMAVWGAGTAREDDPEQAVRAALGMQAAMRDLAETLRGAGAGPVAGVRGSAPTVKSDSPAGPLEPALQLRIGINTGLALLGPVGVAAEYTALGDAVNVAGRLEQAAPPGSILIGHDTYRHVRGIFTVTPAARLTVRGKSEPIRVYTVLEARPRAFRPVSRGIEGVTTGLIGRDAELARLQAAYLTVADAGGFQQVTLVGDAGLGKSRLLDEFRAWAERRPERFLLFLGRGDADLTGVPFGLLRDLLLMRFQIPDSDSAEQARARFEGGIAAYLGAGEAATEAAHFLGHLIGLDYAASPHLAGILSDPRQIRDRAFQTVVRLCRAASQVRPVVVLLEDLHWADDSTLDLLDHVAREAARDPAGLRLLILGLARPALFERRPGWGEGQPGQSRLTLGPLSGQASRRLVEAILSRAAAVPAALRDLIVEHAEGNPFYAEELLKMLIEEGVIQTGGERWTVAPERLSAVRVPPTLTGVVQARLDGLPAEERETLKRSSVIGQVFWDEAVAALEAPATGPAWANVTDSSTDGAAGAGEAAATCRRALPALRRRDLILRRAGSAFAGTAEYAFQHALLREVTYESVLLRQRRRYHAAAARWLLARSGERAEEYAGLIAGHWERAGNADAAATWYGRAAAQAQAAYALDAASAAYERALALLPALAQPERRLTLFAGLGETLFQRGRYAEALEAFTNLRAAAEAAGDALAEGRGWLGISQVQQNQGQFQAAVVSAERAAAIARASADPAAADVRRLLAAALCGRGWAHVRLGDAKAAIVEGEAALAVARAAGDRREEAQAASLVGGGYVLLGRTAAATAHMSEALAVYRELGDRERVAASLNNLGITEGYRGDYRSAIRLCEQALQVARETGARRVELTALANLGEARIAAGDFAAGEADLRQAVAVAGSLTHFALTAVPRCLAQSALGQGRLAEALAAAHESRRRAGELGMAMELGVTWRTLAQIASRQGAPIDLDGTSWDASACFAESLRLLQEAAMVGEQARTLREWARHEREHGDLAHSDAMWQAAKALFAQLEMPLELERMREA